MEQPTVRIPAVAGSAAAMWFIGMGWYTVFGSQWMAFTGVTEEMANSMTGTDMALTFGGSFLAYVVAFYCLVHVNHAFKVNDIKGGIQSAFWTWLGFVATVIYVTNAYQGKSIGLWLIDAGYWLIGLIAGSIILVKMHRPAADPQ